MAGNSAVKSTHERTSVQIATNILEEEVKRLRAVVEHLAARLGDILAHPTPTNQATKANEGFPNVASCPLADLLGAQVSHLITSREVLEELASRIQL